ncbi:MAG: alpha/beta fold hydrolase [Bryobacteraceae bacterium]|jgi:dienelactone hydrolase
MISPKRDARTLRRLLLVASLVFLVVTLSQAQTRVCPNSAAMGHWQGAMSREGADVSVAFDFVCADTELRASFTSLPQRAMEYPFDSVKQIGNRVDLVLGGDTHFSCKFDDSELTGTFKDEDGSGTVRLRRVAEVQLPYTAADVVFKNGDVTLSGSLYVPRGGGLHPAIVMLQGSGPETRWGANRFWADYFGRRGIATLIYDKRGSGKSTGDWQTSDFNSLAGDALAGVSFLQHQGGIDPKKIGIHGHSQGAAIAPLIASQSKAVAFVLADAATGVPMWQTEVFSQQSSVGHSGLKGNDLASADRFIERSVQVEGSGNGRGTLIGDYQAALRGGQTWAKEIEPPAEDSYFWKFFPMIANYNAADYWRRVNVPVLIVEAGNDERVPVEPSVAAIQSALREGHNPDYTIVVFPNAPHSLVEHPQKGEPFRWPLIAPGYADLLASWVLYRESGK